MDDGRFRTADGRPAPAVTAAEMRRVDDVAVEDAGLALVQMMEHAGRGLAAAVVDHAGGVPDAVSVLAGTGGNGGGGLAAARHLRNRGADVDLTLSKPPDAFEGPTGRQLSLLRADGVTPDHGRVPGAAALADGPVVDALVGYGLSGAPRGRVRDLVAATGGADVVSLDVPTGVDATDGSRPGAAVDPALVATLALPKTGLAPLDAPVTLVDLGIPGVVYERAGLAHDPPFGPRFRVDLDRVD